MLSPAQGESKVKLKYIDNTFTNVLIGSGGYCEWITPTKSVPQGYTYLYSIFTNVGNPASGKNPSAISVVHGNGDKYLFMGTPNTGWAQVYIRTYCIANENADITLG